MRVNTRFLLLAVALALLACNASAQVVPRQETSGETDGFEVDGQAERDAEVYLSNEEKSAIQVGNDILAGTDEIPNSDLDYGDEVRTKQRALSSTHVSCVINPGANWPASSGL